jgi:hypothetical protein
MEQVDPGHIDNIEVDVTGEVDGDHFYDHVSGKPDYEDFGDLDDDQGTLWDDDTEKD